MKRPEAPPSHFDVNDELSEEDLREAHKKADEKFEFEHDKEITLQKSSITVPGQNWALVSFAGEKCSQKTEQMGMKLWGCFNNPDDAKEHLRKLGKLEENKWFDIYILEMYNWVAIPPDPNCIDDQEYHDNKLNTIISEHKKEQYRAKEVFDTRKEKLVNNPDINQFNKNKNVLNDLRNDAEKQKQKKKEIDYKEELNKAMKLEFGEEQKQLPKFEIINETNLPSQSKEVSVPSEILKSLDKN